MKLIFWPGAEGLAGLDAELAIDELAFAVAGGTELRGPVQGTARLGGPWRLDLSEANARVPGVIQKRPGVPLVLAGQIGPRLAADALGQVDVTVGRAQLQLSPEVDRKRLSAHGRVAIDELEGVLDPAVPLRGGAVELERLGAELEGGRLFGRAILDRLALAGADGPIAVSGIAIARGRTIRLEQGSALVGGEPVTVTGGYDLGSGALEIQVATDGAKVGPLLAALGGGGRLEGVLDSRAALELRGGIESLRGQGRISVAPGQIRGFSLLREVLGRLAAVPELFAAVRGKDLSRHAQEEFEELSADFRVADQRVHTENLVLRYRHGVAHLQGSVGLVDRSLDLRGRIELAREVQADLGKTRGAPTVIPIAHVGGTVDAPRVELDRQTLARLALAYTGKDRVRKKLDEELGPGGASAVEDLLERLGGGKNRQREDEAP